MNIRKTTGADREALLKFIKASENLTGEEKDCAVELLDIYLKDAGQTDYSFITALGPEGSQAGYACYGKRPLTLATYDLYWILVDPDRRRSGIGRLLLKEVEGLLRDGGAKIIVAETSGLPAYEAARRLYMESGYSEEARIRDFYKPGDDVLFYTKRL
ncbi:MAG: hypothetical protein A2054_00850 [Deltaproteobacteria bacterium GWA2_55_10]|nr:MAG: hypothetical protein A2054_00850 [Deltaproteobacteria bacterium GWA2_55_10]